MDINSQDIHRVGFSSTRPAVEVRYSGLMFFHFSFCNVQSALFSKTVGEMLFLSVSAERILQLAISYKKVFRSTPPRTRDTSILRLKMVENHENE